VPEEYVIYAFGGAGPVHAAAYGAELGINRVYIFPMSPVFSAFGVAASDVVHTRMITRHFSAPINVQALYGEIQSIEATLRRTMLEEGFSTDAIAFRRTLYMRYTRQVNEVGVQISSGPLQSSDRTKIEAAFNAKYEEMYGTGAGHAEAGVEIISIAIDAIGATVKPKLRRVEKVGTDSKPAKKGERRAWFTGAEAGFRSALIYDYTKLDAGNVVDGPAIIETPFTTVVVPPHHKAEVDEYLNLVLHR
jgi:N-methylhydantoinase A